MPSSSPVAIVTGASRGIGLATARRLGADGLTVVGTARTVTPGLRDAVATAIAADLTDPADVERLVEGARDEHGRIDVLVNNAGAFVAHTDGFAAIDDGEWLRALDVNLLSAVRTIRAALPELIRGEGAIVNVASITARLPMAPVVDYAAAKAALVNLGTTLAEELAPQGVRVNTVSPGPTLTPTWESEDGFGAALAAGGDQRLDEFLAAFPEEAGLSTGRLNDPDEVAEVISLLASGRVRNFNGANIVLDGGQDRTAY